MVIQIFSYDSNFPHLPFYLWQFILLFLALFSSAIFKFIFFNLVKIKFQIKLILTLWLLSMAAVKQGAQGTLQVKTLKTATTKKF